MSSSSLKNILAFLRLVFSIIICTVAFAFTWAFSYSDPTLYNAVSWWIFLVFNVSIAFAQIYNFGSSSRLAHFFWIFEYPYYVAFVHNRIEETVFAGLLDNDLTRKFYRPDPENRHLAIIGITLICVLIVALSHLANLAIDKFLLRPEEQPQPDVEAVGAEEKRHMDFRSVLKAVYSDAKKMLTMPFFIAGLKNLFKDVNDSYKNAIGKPIDDKFGHDNNKKSFDKAPTLTKMHMVTDKLGSL
jgi:hypothetical protein